MLTQPNPDNAKPIEEVFATFLESLSMAPGLVHMNIAAGIAREDLLGIDSTNL
ncbi:MAG: hypothetical protein ACJ757_10760 [Gaiellaceae bacterium]